TPMCCTFLTSSSPSISTLFTYTTLFRSDLANVQDAPTKTATVSSFYMDETEITNNEYRQFVYWVRDSILRTKLAILADEVGQTPDRSTRLNSSHVKISYAVFCLKKKNVN